MLLACALLLFSISVFLSLTVSGVAVTTFSGCSLTLTPLFFALSTAWFKPLSLVATDLTCSLLLDELD
ncbi:hypothetical protein R4B61_01895 [Fructilactobacillus vespulae]